MKEIKEQLKIFASKIALSRAEQDLIKTKLLSRVFATGIVHTHRPKASPFSMWLKFIPATLMLILFTGGGVSFAAREALPGDILYPFKIGVTEKVQGLLLVSTKEQAKFEIILVERRSEEAIKLVKTGKMDEKKSATLTEAIEKHTESINSKVETLSITNKVAAKDLAGTLAASLTEQGENMTKASEQQTVNTTNTKNILPLAINMQEKAKVATEKKSTIETEILLDPAGPALTEVDEEKIDDTMDIDLTDESVIDDLEDPKSLEIKTEVKNSIKGTTTETLNTAVIQKPTTQIETKIEIKY